MKPHRRRLALLLALLLRLGSPLDGGVAQTKASLPANPSTVVLAGQLVSCPL